MSSGFLAKLNREFKKDIRNMTEFWPNSTLADEEEEKSLNFYKEVLENKRDIEVVFDFADDKGGLLRTDDNGIRLILTGEEIDKKAKGSINVQKTALVGRPINVRVASIDEEKKDVYLSMAPTQDDVRGNVMRAIYDELKKGKHPVLWGTVSTISYNKLTVNILQKDILGVMPVSEFKNGYVRNLTQAVQRGEPIQFEVVGEAPRPKGAPMAFALSRKRITGDPWLNIKEVAPGSVILVKCIDKPRGRSFYWGKFSGAPDIEIMCDYNAKFAILTGATYKCVVKEFNREEHIFKAKPFELVPEGIRTAVNTAYIKKRGI